jgi:hypothetical protein
MAQAQTFAPTGVRFSSGPAASTRTFVSRNGKFRATLDDTGNSTLGTIIIAVTMARVEAARSIILWRAQTYGSVVAMIQEQEVFVADDGSFLVFQASTSRWLLLKEGKEPFEMKIHVSRPSSPVVAEDRLFLVDQIKDERVVAFWTSYSKEWTVFSVEREKQIEVAPQTIARLEGLMRENILGILARARASFLKARVDAVSPKLSKVAGAAIPTVKFGELRQIHYEFLALLRNPADRVWFERLIEPKPLIPPAGWPPGAVGRGFRYGQWTAWDSNPDMLMTWENDRVVGDWLLNVFDSANPKDEIEIHPDAKRKLRYLGKVSGAILLPAPTLGRPGVMRLYLAPEELAGKVWDDARIEVIENEFPNLVTEDLATDELGFVFSTVTPGTYRMKAIWDKRRGFEDKRAAGPGDYESVWLGPIKVTAGGAENLLLACTNRAAGGETYYAADQMALRKWSGDDEATLVNRDPDLRGKTEIFSQTFSRWAATTNFHTSKARDGLNRVSLRAVASLTNPNLLPRPPELWVSWRRTRFIDGEPAVVLQSLRILDEHGCAYVPQIRFLGKRLAVARFESFPRAAPSFRLVGYGPAPKGEMLFDYTLTNFVRAPLATNSPPLELPADVAAGDVTMRVTRLWGFSANAWMGANFAEAGQPSTNWYASEVNFVDAEGNFIEPAEMCREQKVTRVLGRISRIGSYPEESRRFEFTVNRNAKDP